MNVLNVYLLSPKAMRPTTRSKKEIVEDVVKRLPTDVKETNPKVNVFWGKLIASPRVLSKELKAHPESCVVVGERKGNQYSVIMNAGANDLPRFLDDNYRRRDTWSLTRRYIDEKRS